MWEKSTKKERKKNGKKSGDKASVDDVHCPLAISTGRASELKNILHTQKNTKCWKMGTDLGNMVGKSGDKVEMVMKYKIAVKVRFQASFPSYCNAL